MKLCLLLRPCRRHAGRRSKRSNSILTWPKLTPRWPIFNFTSIETGTGRIWSIGEPFECNPGYALSYHWYANLLAAKGQHEAAHIAIMHALEIDPVSLITLVWAGVTSHMAHRFDDAIKHYQSALELDPEFIWAHMYLAQALEQKGDYKGAVREFENTIKLAGGSNCVLAMKAHAHAVAGDTTSARRILRGLKSSTNHKCMPSYDIAATHAALGESKQMGFWLNRACNERNMKVFTLMQDPRFDSAPPSFRVQASRRSRRAAALQSQSRPPSPPSKNTGSVPTSDQGCGRYLWDTWKQERNKSIFP